HIQASRVEVHTSARETRTPHFLPPRPTASRGSITSAPRTRRESAAHSRTQLHHATSTMIDSNFFESAFHSHPTQFSTLTVPYCTFRSLSASRLIFLDGLLAGSCR